VLEEEVLQTLIQSPNPHHLLQNMNQLHLLPNLFLFLHQRHHQHGSPPLKQQNHQNQNMSCHKLRLNLLGHRLQRYPYRHLHQSIHLPHHLIHIIQDLVVMARHYYHQIMHRHLIHLITHLLATTIHHHHSLLVHHHQRYLYHHHQSLHHRLMMNTIQELVDMARHHHHHHQPPH